MPFLRFRVFAIFSVLLLSLFPIRDAQAWKPSTHVYFSDQAADDAVDDGKISIYRVDYAEGKVLEKVGDYSVDLATLEAIKNYRAHYHAGTFGPDAYPDILTGQQAIHADYNAQNGPNANDWLEYLWRRGVSDQADPKYKTPQVRAFVLGFLSHAAGDLYAHTFVNHFTGGVFELGENAIRHVVLEGYIDKRTPALQNPVASIDENIEGGVDDFIYDVLINAAPGSELGRLLKKEAGAEYSVPRIYSEMKVTLSESIKESSEWNPWALYKKEWIKDIDEGLKEWPRLSHRIAQAIMFEGNFDRAEKLAADYSQNHLLSMSGAPDAAGASIGLISAIVPESVKNTLALLKNNILAYIMKYTFGMDWETFKDYLKNPERSFDLVLNRQETRFRGRATPISLMDFNKKHLLLNDEGFHHPEERFDWKKFRPAYNSVVMTKLIYLPPSEINRLLRDLGAPESIKLTKPNVMLGFHRSLDRGNEWLGPSKMVFAQDPAIYTQIFMHIEGEALLQTPKKTPENKDIPVESPEASNAEPPQAPLTEPEPEVKTDDDGSISEPSAPDTDTDTEDPDSKPSETKPVSASPSASSSPNDAKTSTHMIGGGKARPANESAWPWRKKGSKNDKSDSKEEKSAVQESGQIDEVVEVCIGKTKVAPFKKDVMKIRVNTKNKSVVEARFRDTSRLEIKGLKLGETLVTVEGEVVRYQAGANVDLQANQPFRQTFLIQVVDCRNAEDVYRKLKSLFDKAEQDIAATGRRMLSELAGKTLMNDNGNVYQINAGVINGWTHAARKRIQELRVALEKDWSELKKKKLSVEDFYARCYQKVTSTIGDAWSLYLREASNEGGRISLFYAELIKEKSALNEEEEAENKRMNQDFPIGGAQYEAAQNILKLKISMRKQELFNGWADRYRENMNGVVAGRKLWGAEMWSWYDFSNELSSSPDDVHAYAKNNYRVDLKALFDSTPESGSLIDNFTHVSGSQDRFITGFDEYDWVRSRPYPDLQTMKDFPGVLRMTDIKETSVESLR